jgi:hypothetical protein
VGDEFADRLGGHHAMNDKQQEVDGEAGDGREVLDRG